MKIKKLIIMLVITSYICSGMAMMEEITESEAEITEEEIDYFKGLKKVISLEQFENIKIVARNGRIGMVATIKKDNQPRFLYATQKELNEEAYHGSTLALPEKGKVTHIALNNKGDFAYVDSTNRIHYLQEYFNPDPKIMHKVTYIQDTHKEPIQRFYMDDNFIVSGSSAPNIRMWQIDKEKDRIKEPSIFEQSHAHLLYYGDGALVYGDWRWQGRFSLLSPGKQQLNIALKEQFIPITKKIPLTKYDHLLINKKIQPFTYDLPIIRNKTSHPPLCDYKNGKLLLYHDKQKEYENEIKYYLLYRNQKTFIEQATFTGIDSASKLKNIYIADTIGRMVIFVSDTSVKYYRDAMGTIPDNTLTRAWTVPSKTDEHGKEYVAARIAASALDGQTLYLVIHDETSENQEEHSYWLYSLDVSTLQ